MGCLVQNIVWDGWNVSSVISLLCKGYPAEMFKNVQKFQLIWNASKKLL